MVNIRRGVLVFGGIALVVLAIFYWRSRSDDVPPLSPTVYRAAEPRPKPVERPRTLRGPRWFAPVGIPDQRIAGVVTTEDGKPVRGANVYLQSTESRASLLDEPHAVTDANGHFDFGTQPPLDYVAKAEAPGLRAAFRQLHVSDPSTRPWLTQLRLVVSPCAISLYGTVKDISGGMVAGARITESMTPGGVETDERGAYELCIRRGVTDVYVSADGYALLRRSAHVFSRTRRDFELVPGATVVGHVVRAANKGPVDNALVEIREVEGAQSVRYTKSNAEGRFALDGLMSGKYKVIAVADGLASPEPTEVIVEAGTPPDDVECVLFAAYSVKGKLVQKVSGAALSGVKVYVSTREVIRGTERSALTQEDGSFVLERLLPAEYELRTMVEPFSADHPLTRFILKDADVTGLVLEVPQLGAVEGRLVRDGEAVPQAWVTLLPTPHGDVTDADGRFRIEHVLPGNYTLYAEPPPGDAFGRSKSLTVRAGETTPADLEITYAASIEGVVVDEKGAAVPDVFLRFSLLGGRDVGMTTTAEDGSFAVRALSGGGTYDYEVRHRDGSLQTFPPISGKRFPPVAVADANTHVTGLRVVIRHEQPSISGRVLGADGQPVPDIVVRAWTRAVAPVPIEASSTTTDASGAFMLRGLFAGTYAVDVRSIRGEAREENVATGRSDVELRMSASATIEASSKGSTACQGCRRGAWMVNS